MLSSKRNWQLWTFSLSVFTELGSSPLYFWRNSLMYVLTCAWITGKVNVVDCFSPWSLSTSIPFWQMKSFVCSRTLFIIEKIIPRVRLSSFKYSFKPRHYSKSKTKVYTSEASSFENSRMFSSWKTKRLISCKIYGICGSEVLIVGILSIDLTVVLLFIFTPISSLIGLALLYCLVIVPVVSCRRTRVSVLWIL